jgi:hypothetical protein
MRSCGRVQRLGCFNDMRKKRVGESEFVVVPAVHRTQIAIDDLRQRQVDNRAVGIPDDVAADERVRGRACA